MYCCVTPHLYNDSVVNAHVAGVDLYVVVGGDGDDLQLLLGGRLERLVLDPESLGACPVHLPQQSNHPGLLAGAGGPVHQEVGEIPRTGLKFVVYLMHGPTFLAKLRQVHSVYSNRDGRILTLVLSLTFFTF